jgi:hypothetical protein
LSGREESAKNPFMGQDIPADKTNCILVIEQNYYFPVFNAKIVIPNTFIPDLLNTNDSQIVFIYSRFEDPKEALFEIGKVPILCYIAD